MPACFNALLTPLARPKPGSRVWREVEIVADLVLVRQIYVYMYINTNIEHSRDAKEAF